MKRFAIIIFVVGFGIACDKSPTAPDPPNRMYPSVDSMKVSPNPTTLWPSDTLTFRAEVYVTGNISEEVRWAATCNSNWTGTLINRYDGLFEAPAMETECSVEATSVADPTKSGLATVTVKRGNLIAFGGGQDGNDDIYVIRPDGSGLRRITSDSAQDLRPTWSPDGQRIAFISNRDGQNRIYSIRSSGATELTKLTPEIDYAMYPAWSPEDGQIAFLGRVAPGDPFEIYTIDLATGELTRITHENKVGGKVPFNPTWSPDGEKIAYSTFRDGNWEVYTANADGTNHINLTQHPSADRSPAWSLDGTKIAFNSSRDGNSEIYLMNIDGSKQTNVTNHPNEDMAPAWSLDSKMIALTSFNEIGDDTEIYIINLESGERTNLTNAPQRRDNTPAWQLK